MEQSCGSTFTGSGFAIACEQGTVTILRDSVIIADQEGRETHHDFPVKGFGGVKEEVQAWAEGMETSNWNERLKPEEALGDLEVVEAILRSGERDGAPVDLHLQ